MSRLYKIKKTLKMYLCLFELNFVKLKSITIYFQYFIHKTS